jgi:hypothetical protein
MGVDVSAVLFVGLLEKDMPKNTIELLTGKAKMYEGWEDELDEDSGFGEWIEYVEKVDGVKQHLELMRNSEYSDNPKVLVGFAVLNTDSFKVVPPEKIVKGISEATEAFQKLFGVAPKVYFFPRWW